MTRAGLLLSVLAFALPAGAQTGPAAADLLEQKTLARLRALDERTDGVLGVAAIDLRTGRELAWNADVAMPSASTIKVAILVELYRQAAAGRLSLDQKVSLRPEDLIGSSEHVKARLARGPAQITLRELASDMIEVSDNTATNALIPLVGPEAVNRLLDGLGLSQTRLRRKMLDSEAARRGDDNTATPAGLARLAQAIYQGKLVSGAAAEEMLGMMKRARTSLRAVAPAAVPVASKPGEVPGAACELAIVYLEGRPFAAGVMSSFLAEGANPLPDAARILYSHFERLAQSNRYGNRLAADTR